MRHRRSKPRTKAPSGCHKLCRLGNPNRDQWCTCEGCNGKAHGSHKITMQYMIDKVHHKLMDETLTSWEFGRWLVVMEALLNNNVRKLRSVPRRKKEAA